ncbi:MAG: hypothetical protein ACYDA0_16185 [Candidatus Dormibacteraceae bacterium]
MQAVHSSAVSVRHEAQTRSGLQRIGGAAGVIFGVVDIAVAAILIVSLSRSGAKLPFEANPAGFYDYLHANLPVILPLMLVETVAAIFALAFVRAIDERLRPLAPTASSIAALFGYAGFVILMLDFASFVMLEQSILGGDSPQAVEGMIPAWSVLTGTSGIVGGFLTVAWLLVVNWIAARRGGLPKGLGYFGLLGAVVAAAGLLLSIHGLNHLLVNIWEIAVGAVLFMGTQPAAGRNVADLP